MMAKIILDLDGMSFPNMSQQYKLVLLNNYMSRWKQIPYECSEQAFHSAVVDVELQGLDA